MLLLQVRSVMNIVLLQSEYYSEIQNHPILAYSAQYLHKSVYSLLQ